MNYVREYWGRISSGEIVTSRRVKAVYGRLMQEMDAPPDDSAYYFDEETGERPILFIEQRTAKRRCLRLSRCICLSRTMRARRKSIP